MTNTLAKAGALAALSDESLAAEVAMAAAALPTHIDRFAHELAAGSRPPEAARRTGEIGFLGGHPYDLARRPDVSRLVHLLREQARRRAAVTIEGQITRLQDLSVRAEEARELATAVAAEKEVNKLAGLCKPDLALPMGEGASITINFMGPPPAQLDPAAAAKDVTPAQPAQPAQPEQPQLRRLSPRARRGPVGSLEPRVPEPQAVLAIGGDADDPLA
jgi:hypothetical protein